MTIKTISYQKAFVIGPYLQHRIGIEIELDNSTGSGETAESALDLAKMIVEDWHKANNPHLEGTTVADVPARPAEIQIEKAASEERILVMIKDIQNETVLRNAHGVGGLLSWQKLAAQHPKLQEAFDKRKAEIEYEMASK